MAVGSLPLLVVDFICDIAGATSHRNFRPAPDSQSVDKVDQNSTRGTGQSLANTNSECILYGRWFAGVTLVDYNRPLLWSSKMMMNNNKNRCTGI
jgi:hypothetical protein